ncbi:phosphatidylserine decarboxylase [uncultured Victivallis sp.]|uniref:phosphatidylserine decarboxylase n=1 Tax=uncultured Victivallis sp. TaxID=354118 RepID=UPI0025F456E9|nr:phosphatidylserine decarboxylase [uncultured Victivallis sp.]
MMTLTRYGLREWGTAGLITLVILIGCWYLIRHGHPGWGWSVAAVVVVLFLAFAAFFRNPSRTIPADPAVLVGPADGVVRDIEVVEDFNFPPFDGKARRIGIFLSVLNVHVNRAPAELEVESKFYREGEYLDARNSECAKRNEAMTIAGTATAGGKRFPLAVRQISGAIARRIVCPVDPGRKLRKGEVYGMIKFGSRTELYLPVDGFEINVKVGDRVYGGETIMATVKE